MRALAGYSTYHVARKSALAVPGCLLSGVPFPSCAADRDWYVLHLGMCVGRYMQRKRVLGRLVAQQ